MNMAVKPNNQLFARLDKWNERTHRMKYVQFRSFWVGAWQVDIHQRRKHFIIIKQMMHVIDKSNDLCVVNTFVSSYEKAKLACSHCGHPFLVYLF